MQQPPEEEPTFLGRITGFMRAEGESRDDQREVEEDLRATMVAYSTLTSQFAMILTLSSAIGSLGLMADSAVAIVGAMLIAPLMKPILAYAYGIVTADGWLQIRAAITLAAGILITILVAGLVEMVVGLRGPTTQIMSRTHPSLIDLGVAVAAGLAASMASVRRNVADTLPGVAIAVALVPPLCVSGIGFSIGAWSVGGGATLLFAVNLVAIIITSAAVFLIDGHGQMRRASHGFMFLITVAAAALAFPLTHAMNQLRADDLAQETVETYLLEQFPKNQTVHPNDLSRLDTLWYSDHVFVFVEIKASQSDFTKENGLELQRRLHAAFEKPVNLKVQLLLSAEFRIYPHKLPGDAKLEYGVDELVPRR